MSQHTQETRRIPSAIPWEGLQNGNQVNEAVSPGVACGSRNPGGCRAQQGRTGRAVYGWHQSNGVELLSGPHQRNRLPPSRHWPQRRLHRSRVRSRRQHCAACEVRGRHQLCGEIPGAGQMAVVSCSKGDSSTNPIQPAVHIRAIYARTVDGQLYVGVDGWVDRTMAPSTEIYQAVSQWNVNGGSFLPWNPFGKFPENEPWEGKFWTHSAASASPAFSANQLIPEATLGAFQTFDVSGKKIEEVSLGESHTC